MAFIWSRPQCGLKLIPPLFEICRLPHLGVYVPKGTAMQLGVYTFKENLVDDFPP